MWKLVFLLLLCVNILLGLFLLLISVTSASTSNSSSELELYLSSVKRGTDNCDKCEPEFSDVGREYGVLMVCVVWNVVLVLEFLSS